MRLPVLSLLLALACNSNHQTTRELEEKYDVRAATAGEDCLVLIIQTDTALDDRTVEAMHYGTAKFAAYPGGVQQFAADRHFRAVVYRDAAGDLWSYGSITRREAQSLRVCR